jgi:calcium-dependent protein kinase
MQESDFEMEAKHNVSPEAKDLVTRLLARNPDDRLSAEEAMTHPFFDILHKDRSNLINEEVLEALMHRSETKFMQIVIYYFALKWVNPADIEEERATFIALDSDMDGRISFQDLCIALKGRYTPYEIQEAIIGRHQHAKKYITFLEFLAYTLDKGILLDNIELVGTVFQFFDKDNEGSIEDNELNE